MLIRHAVHSHNQFTLKSRRKMQDKLKQKKIAKSKGNADLQVLTSSSSSDDLYLAAS